MSSGRCLRIERISQLAILAGCLVVLPVAGQAPAEETQSQQPAQWLWGDYQASTETLLQAVFVDTDGSRAKFWTDRYLRPGFQAGSFLLELQPVNADQAFFNFARLTATGIGDSSPYQTATFRLRKNRTYDFQANFRRYSYFFGLPEFALGLHPENSVGRFATFQLKLFPGRTAGVDVGYRRNQILGTAFSTADLTFDAFQLSQPHRVSSDEFWATGHLNLRPVALQVRQSYIRFRDDTQFFPNAPNPLGLRGNQLAGGQRDLPTRISTPVTMVMGQYAGGERYDATARYIYSKGEVDLVQFDTLLYRIGRGAFPVRQILSGSGISDRPSHEFSFSQQIGLTDRLTLHHLVFYRTYTITGFLDVLGVLRFINEQQNVSLDVPVESHGGSITDYTLFRNQFELDYELARSFSLFGTYNYSDRHIGHAFHELQSGATVPEPRPVVTITHAGGGGFAWRPSQLFRLRFDAEKGSASQAFLRNEPLDFLRWRVFSEIRPRDTLFISARATIADNKNETAGVNFDLDDRELGFQLSYVPSENLILSGGYNFYRIRSSTDIVFFLVSELTQGKSLYETNTHVVNVDLKFPLGSRLSLRAGYQFVKDTGESFPLKMHVPHGGLSLQLHPSIYFEADWWHYSYNERFFAAQDYRANVLAAGLRFRFPE